MSPSPVQSPRTVKSMTSFSSIASQDLELASSLIIDSQVNSHVDYLLQLKGEDLKRSYKHFNSMDQTLSSLLVLAGFLCAFSLPYVIVLGLALACSMTIYEYTAATTTLVLLLALNGVVWLTYFQQKRIVQQHDGSLPEASRRYLQVFQMRVFLVVNLLVCYRHISRTVIGPCPTVWNFQENWVCNPVGDSQAIVPENSIIIMLIPIIYAMSTRGANIDFAAVLWLMSMATLVFSLFYAQAGNSILYVVYYAIGSVVILIEARRQSYFLFFTHRKLQEILKEREKAADEANAEEMRHMIANVAHDLKTPLASFLAGIEFISQVVSDNNSSDHGDVQLISTCVDNMRNTNSFMLMTINRCIDYTKASKGMKLKPKFETIDLMETLALPLSCMRDIQQRVSIVLEPLPLAKDICSHIITDKQWLQENVLCLLSNAVKYSHEGQVSVRVKTTHSRRVSFDSIFESDHTVQHALRPASKELHTEPATASLLERIRIEVEDHGIGLTDEAMTSLFSPFKQAQRLAGGTGLGLFSLGKRIEALEGRCGVSRRRDGSEGSMFWFEIPYRPDKEAAKLLPKFVFSPISLTRPDLTSVVHNESGKTDDLASGKGLNTSNNSLTDSDTPIGEESLSRRQHQLQEPLDILLVDDSPAILKMTSMMLKRHKHRVTTAVNGVEAVKAIADRVKADAVPFDVILMDLQMPIMDGLEATRRLRRLEFTGSWSSPSASRSTDEDDCASKDDMILTRNVVLGVSANSDAETTGDAYSVGVDSFMAKPFSLDCFYKTYQEVLSRRNERALLLPQNSFETK